jgi:glycosyltransferase involved in cell wall biosynthesis
MPFGAEFFATLYRFHLLLAAPLRENTPRSVLDAMAAGIPYLAYDTYYYDQLLESGAGVVVLWLDEAAMTSALIRLDAGRAHGRECRCIRAPEYTGDLARPSSGVDSQLFEVKHPFNFSLDLFARKK